MSTFMSTTAPRRAWARTLASSAATLEDFELDELRPAGMMLSSLAGGMTTRPDLERLTDDIGDGASTSGLCTALVRRGESRNDLLGVE